MTRKCRESIMIERCEDSKCIECSYAFHQPYESCAGYYKTKYCDNCTRNRKHDLVDFEDMYESIEIEKGYIPVDTSKVDFTKADENGVIIYDIPPEEMQGDKFVLDPIKHEKYRRKS